MENSASENEGNLQRDAASCCSSKVCVKATRNLMCFQPLLSVSVFLVVYHAEPPHTKSNGRNDHAQ